MAISRPVGYFSLAAVAVFAYVWSSSDSTPPKATATAKHKSAAKGKEAGWDFPDTSDVAPFPKPKRSRRDLFAPLVMVEHVAPLVKPEEDLIKVPAALADGEGSWAYTGMVEVDGKRMALLENQATHVGAYVNEGQVWKKARIVAISVASVLMADEKGTVQTVYRFNPNQPPKEKAGGIDPNARPLDLSGPIGRQFQINPTGMPRGGRTFSAPPSDTP